MEKKEARRPGSCEMEDEAGRVFEVVELLDEDEEEKFEELVLLSRVAGEDAKGLRRAADSSPGGRISQKLVTGTGQHRCIHKQGPVF